jgi:hypothetical protein
LIFGSYDCFKIPKTKFQETNKLQLLNLNNQRKTPNEKLVGIFGFEFYYLGFGFYSLVLAICFARRSFSVGGRFGIYLELVI